VGPNSRDVLAKVHTQSQAIGAKSELVLQKYVAISMLSGVEEEAVKVYARRLYLYLVSISKDALFISLNVEKSDYIQRILSTELALEDVEQTLVYGNAVANVPELAQLCLLAKMLQVGKLWTTYKNHLNEIQDTKSISETLLMTLVPVGASLAHQMEQALELFEHDDGSCDVVSHITDNEWSNLIAETNKQRMLSQRVTRLYFQLAKGLQTHDRLSITQALSDA
jgi:hypothetical protein